MEKLTDRLVLAATVAKGKRVLDVGGRGMAPCEAPNVHGPLTFGKKVDPAHSPFAYAYGQIGKNASEYRVMDVRNEPDVHYPLNLSEKGCVEKLHAILLEYKPEVIICMETLEHVNYHFEVMNEFAFAVREFGTTVLITIPHNGNWILNALGWNHDHCVAFFKDIADRFILRSDLGKFDVKRYPCFQMYLWYWRIAYILSGCQPFSWGYLISPKKPATGG